MWCSGLEFITLTVGIPEHDRMEYLRVAKAYERDKNFEKAYEYYKLAAEVGTVYEHF